MVMHKIFFGTIVFSSLAFLAACGGGGSGSTGATGAAGAAGATGDTGATGSISVPTDSDLAISLNGRLDIDSTALDYQNTITISGMDNETMDSRLRYYAYQGTSATVKTSLLDTATAISIATASPAYATSGVIDSRLKTSDNLTLVMPANAAIDNEDTSYIIVCAGNEAGDAASCASVAIRDRVAHGAVALGTGEAAASGGTALTGDARVSIAYGNGAFQVLADNASVATGADNASRGYRIANDNKSNAYLGTAQDSTVDNISGSVNLNSTHLQIPTNTMARLVSNVTFKGNDAYFVSQDNMSQHDNLTVYKRTNGIGDYEIDNESNLGPRLTNVGLGAKTVLLIGSDGTDLFIVHDNSSADGLIGHIMHGDNHTITQSTANGYQDNSSILGADGTTSTSTMAPICATTTTDKMVIVTDNGSALAGFDVHSLYDNGTLTQIKADANVSTDNGTATSGLITLLACDLTLVGSTYILTLVEDTGDNITVLTSDNLTDWTQIYETATGQTGLVAVSAAATSTADVWAAVDDGTDVDLYHSDNGTNGQMALVHTIATCDLGGIAHDNGTAGSARIAIACENGTDAKVDIYYE